MTPVLMLAALMAGPATELWAGHQVVLGSRKIPLLGERETRTDTFVLARVRREGDTVELAQLACRVEMRAVAGVGMSIPESTVRKLPLARFRFARAGDGAWKGEWRSGWDERDWDGDGERGVSVVVDAPLCGGEVRVAAATLSRAVAREHGRGLAGELVIEFRQRFLGASNVCLELGGTDLDEAQRGSFVYVPVPDDATCESLAAAGWPARLP